MTVKSFTINSKNNEAKNGVCEITFDLGLQAKQIVHGVCFLAEERLIGNITNQDGLKSGTYKLTLDFIGLGNGPHIVRSIIYKQPNSEIIQEGVPFTIIAINIGDPQAMPEPIRLELKSKQAVRESNSIINYKLSGIENLDLSK
ncbi:MAG TPA: hypothetical protein VFJ43_07930, partial [Bacteroidia bacterium]|nr:hypothetical protein [Bacteroidia bacterium]